MFSTAISLNFGLFPWRGTASIVKTLETPQYPKQG